MVFIYRIPWLHYISEEQTDSKLQTEIDIVMSQSGGECKVQLHWIFYYTIPFIIRVSQNYPFSKKKAALWMNRRRPRRQNQVTTQHDLLRWLFLYETKRWWKVLHFLTCDASFEGILIKNPRRAWFKSANCLLQLLEDVLRPFSPIKRFHFVRRAQTKHTSQGARQTAWDGFWAHQLASSLLNCSGIVISGE